MSPETTTRLAPDYRALVEHVPAVVYLARPGADGEWLYVSPQIESLLGYRPDEWRRDPDLWLSRIHPEDRERVVDAERRFAATAIGATRDRAVPSLRQEYRIVARDGRTLWISDESFVVPDHGEEPLLRGVLVDITKQKRAEQALRESEERYRSLFEEVPVGMYRTTPGGRILDANQALAEIVGYPDAATLLERDPQVVYVDGSDRRRWMELMDREGEVRGYELRTRRPDGTEIWVRDTARAVRDARGEILFYEGMLEDVTDRRQWERALAESERRTRAIIEASMDAIVAMDERGCIADANPAAEALFGWSRDELIGRSVTDLVASGERGRHETGVARRLAGAPRPASGVRVESVGLRRDGTEFPVEVTIAELEGFPEARFTAFLRDLSERRGAEAALRESETRFRLIAENARDIIYRYRLRPSPAYDYISPAVETLTGYAPEEFASDPDLWTKLIHPDDAGRVAELFASGAAFTETYRNRWITKDGRVVWCESSNAPIHDSRGEMEAFVGVVRDVTDQVSARQNLELSLETLQRSFSERRVLMARLMEAEEQERKRIAGEIHDDSVQAMVAVGLRLDMLKAKLGDDLAEVISDLRGTVNTAVGRLRNLIFNLRPPALDEDGLEPALRLYLEEVERASGLGFDLGSRVTGEIPEASRLVLYRIAQEAVANVRRHAQATEVRVHLEPDGGGIRLRVVDDGRGFPVPTDGESPPGHLGLSSMKEHAELAGGRLSIRSQPGMGTTVEVWIPER